MGTESADLFFTDTILQDHIRGGPFTVCFSDMGSRIGSGTFGYQVGQLSEWCELQSEFVAGDSPATYAVSEKEAAGRLELNNMYLAVEHLKATRSEGFRVMPVAINEATLVETYTVSSWANAEGFASQHGAMTLLAPPTATEVETVGCLIGWKSSRPTRVCRSTLAAEASAADMGVDRAAFLNVMICEIMQRQPSYRIRKTLRMLAITDCKSLQTDGHQHPFGSAIHAERWC